MIDIILYQPEIPPNTGTIMRLCATTNCRLHLIEPLGFNLSDKSLKRAGMDYRNRIDYFRHQNFPSCLEQLDKEKKEKNINFNIYCLTTKAHKYYHQSNFTTDDILIFGPETRGIPAEILASYNDNNKLKIPMAKNERSLNLAMSVAVVVYEALRQNEFESIC